MDENKSIKTNVSFESAGLKLAGRLYTPNLDTSPSLPAIVVGPPGSSVKEQAARVCTRGCSEDKFKGQLDRARAADLIERVKPAPSPPARLLASVCVDWPNSGLVRLLVGGPKFGWLKRLKNSPRGSISGMIWRKNSCAQRI